MTVQLSIYRNSYDTKGVDVSLGAVAERIKDGKRGLDEKTERCHFILQNAPDGYNQVDVLCTALHTKVFQSRKPP